MEKIMFFLKKVVRMNTARGCQLTKLTTTYTIKRVKGDRRARRMQMGEAMTKKFFRGTTNVGCHRKLLSDKVHIKTSST